MVIHAIPGFRWVADGRLRTALKPVEMMRATWEPMVPWYAMLRAALPFDRGQNENKWLEMEAVLF